MAKLDRETLVQYKEAREGVQLLKGFAAAWLVMALVSGATALLILKEGASSSYYGYLRMWGVIAGGSFVLSLVVAAAAYYKENLDELEFVGKEKKEIQLN